MSELKIFVDANENTTNKVVICQENATKLGIANGASVEVENPDNGKKTSATVEISNMVLDFAGQVSKNTIETLEFTGVELVIRPMSSTGLVAPTPQVPKVPSGTVPPAPTPSTLTPLPTPPPSPPQTPAPTPTPVPSPQQAPALVPPPQPTPTPTPSPQMAPTPQQVPTPQYTPTPTPPPQPGYWVPDSAMKRYRMSHNGTMPVPP